MAVDLQTVFVVPSDHPMIFADMLPCPSISALSSKKIKVADPLKARTHGATLHSMARF